MTERDEMPGQCGYLLLGATKAQACAEEHDPHRLRQRFPRRPVHQRAPYPVNNVRNVFTPISKSSANEQCLT